MRQVKVMETNILHASDVIYWLDGSSGETLAEMLRIPDVLDLQLTQRPRDLKVVHGAGKTALLRRPTNEIIAGVASDSDKQMPAEPAYPVSGVISDKAGRYIPRRFSISAGNAAGHALVAYPSPLGTRLGPAGGLIGTLRFSTTGDPVPWGLISLNVTTAIGTTLTFRCQATGRGDFILSLQRLPPLPEGVDHYTAELTVHALTTAREETPIDPAALTVMNVGQLDSDNTYSNPIGLNVVPGEIRLIRSSNRDHLAVQPS